VTLVIHAQRGKFVPVVVEAPFQLTTDILSVAGRIDRVDQTTNNDICYSRVVDYKSKPMKLVLSDVYHGLALQLLLYLWAVAKPNTGEKTIPAGALYFPIENNIRRLDNPPDKNLLRESVPRLDGLILAEPLVLDMMGGEELVPAALKKDGSFTTRSQVVTREEMAKILYFCQEKVLQLATGILSGLTEISPYRKSDNDTACGYCDFRPVCRFDTMSGNRYRYLQGYSYPEALSKLTAGSEKGEIL
jgi:ATP-dependent helicase/nuclease subunit B